MKKLSRADRIKAGKLWQVYPDGEPDFILCEGSKIACEKYIREKNLKPQFKRGQIRIGKLICEP